jgi:hypothetical protein
MDASSNAASNTASPCNTRFVLEHEFTIKGVEAEVFMNTPKLVKAFEGSVAVAVRVLPSQVKVVGASDVSPPGDVSPSGGRRRLVGSNSSCAISYEITSASESTLKKVAMEVEAAPLSTITAILKSKIEADPALASSFSITVTGSSSVEIRSERIVPLDTANTAPSSSNSAWYVVAIIGGVHVIGAAAYGVYKVGLSRKTAALKKKRTLDEGKYREGENAASIDVVLEDENGAEYQGGELTSAQFETILT